MSSRSSPRIASNTQDFQNFRTEFKKFAPDAFRRFDANNQTITQWAREEARALYHAANASVPFLTAYNCLLKFAGVILQRAEEKAAAESVTHNVSDYISSARMNKVMYSEHSRWWDAFVAEAEDEELTPENEQLTAEDRFAWHCAKILQRHAKLPLQTLANAARVWIDSKNN